MDNNELMTILIMIGLVIMSGYFSATETAFSSLSRSRLKTMADEGDKKAARVLKYAEDYDRLLSTVLVGNNLVNILLSAIATVFFIRYFGENGPTVATAVITLVVLLFGEITPKSLAKEYPERFAKFSVRFLVFFIYILTPVNFLLSFWKKMLSKLVNVEEDRRLTENDLLTIVEEAEQGGGIDEQESELIRSAIEFNDVEVEEIATPRVDITAVPNDIDREALEEVFSHSGFMRLPVYEGSIDNIVGVIHLKDFYEKEAAGDHPAEEIMQPVLFITASMKIGALLKLLQKKKTHMAVVADEFGGTLGIVTIEDILEELVGEIWDEHDDVVEDFIQINDHQYIVLCSADVDMLEDFFEVKCDESDAVTVGGWVLEQFERIPQEGDCFQYENLNIAVTRTDGRRVLEILVTRLNPDGETTEETTGTEKKE